jgi:tripartite-type tricarboxylate transporter receptor subunit TctC
MLAPVMPRGNIMIRSVVRCLALFAALLVGGQASAQSGYPVRPVKFLVPFPGGGINDVLARILGDKLSAKWGQPVVVENRTGAGGNIGAEVVAQAEPDGYTILVAPPGPLAINDILYKHISYKPGAFVPIMLVGSVPNLVIVRKDLPVNSVKELIAYIRQNNGKVNYGSQGSGATPHLTANMFMNMTGTHMTHVPYRGETLVLNDMLGGHVDIFFGNISAGLALYRAGKVKVLAVTDKARAAPIPEVPTTAEAGLPGLVSVGWFAMAGPPKMKPELAELISRAANEALKLEDVQAKFRAVGVEPMGGTPAAMAAFVKEESARWGDVIRKNNIVLD